MTNKIDKNDGKLNEILLVNKITRHELLNVLNVISGFLEVFKEKKDYKLLDKIFDAIERGVKLIDQMKELEKLVVYEDALKPLNVAEIINSICSKYNIDFTIKGNCTVLADEALSTVFDNIIRNAITHGKTEKIDVTVERLNGLCEIRIADYGKGIPDEIKDRLFDEGFFYGETGHTGLGLYIVKRVVERYGGDVSVEGNKPKGAVFVVRLRAND